MKAHVTAWLFLLTCAASTNLHAQVSVADPEAPAGSTPSSETELPPQATKAELPPELNLSMAADGLAELAPSTSGLFIEFDRLSDFQAWLQRDEIRSLLGFSLGLRGRDQIGFERWLVQRIGLTSEVIDGGGGGVRLALAAPSLSRLFESVLLVESPLDSKAADLIPPLERVPQPVDSEPPTYRSRTRSLVSVQGRRAVVSLSGQRGEYFDAAVALLSGHKENGLARDQRYARLIEQLPPGCFARGYVDLEANGGGGGGWIASTLGSRMDQAGFGLIGGEKQLTLAIRGVRETVADAAEKREKSPAAYRRLARLPRTTLGAWGMKADPIGAYRAMIPEESRGAVRFYRDLMMHAAGEADVERDLLSKLGPEVVWIWGQTGDEAPGIPRIALELEARDARGCARLLTEWVQEMVAVLKPGTGGATANGDDERSASPSKVLEDDLDEAAASNDVPEKGRADETEALVRVSDYIGLPVTTLPLKLLVPESDRQSALGVLLSEVSPSWTALDGWLVIALSEEHLREIIDAHRRFAPTLSELVEDVGLDQVRRGASELALLQPSLASEVLRAWSEGLVSGAPSFLDPEVWGKPVEGDDVRPRPARVGIGIASEPESPGKVSIERVYQDAPASGRLQVGDKIVGVNGSLLPLHGTVGQLRRQIRSALRDRMMTIRVERDGQFVDVVIPLHRPGSRDALMALERFAQVGADIPFASYSVLNSSPDRFHANITLHFR